MKPCRKLKRKVTSSDRDFIKFVKEMRGGQMRKKRGTSKTCVEKYSIPSVVVHVANNYLGFFAATYVFVVWNFTRLNICWRIVFSLFFSWVGGWRGWWGSTAFCSYALTIWCRKLISRPSWVFRRSCCLILGFVAYKNIMTQLTTCTNSSMKK